MREHPIIFSTAMIRAILDDQKKMTRRVKKSDKSPYEVGMILWVRETWMPETEGGIPTGGYIYRATDRPESDNGDPLKWTPSIFMPRKASRITLEITGVKLERLQDISEEAAKAEGIGHGFMMNAGWPDYQHVNPQGVCELTQDTPKMSFASLWDSLNAKRGYGWDVNPMVRCITFRRVKP